jgi:hypothetical protein
MNYREIIGNLFLYQAVHLSHSRSLKLKKLHSVNTSTLQILRTGSTGQSRLFSERKVPSLSPSQREYRLKLCESIIQVSRQGCLSTFLTYIVRDPFSYKSSRIHFTQQVSEAQFLSAGIKSVPSKVQVCSVKKRFLLTNVRDGF